MPDHKSPRGAPLSEAELADASVYLPIPHGAGAVRLPVVVRHTLHDPVSGLSNAFSLDDPTDPVHTFVLELPEPLEGALRLDHDAFAAAATAPGAVVRADAASADAGDDDRRTDRPRRRMIECARVRVRAHSDRHRIEGACSWQAYLGAFGADGDPVGLAVDTMLEDGVLDAEFELPIRIDRVFYVLSVDVHPVFRGQRLGARLLMHALRRLITSPMDLAFLHAWPAPSRYDTAVDAGAEPKRREEGSSTVGEESTALMAYASRLLFRVWADEGYEISEPGEARDLMDDLVWALGADLLPERDGGDVVGASVAGDDAEDEGADSVRADVLSDADVFGVPVEGGGVELAWPHGVLPPRAKVGAHGQIADIDLAALNPVCVGVGRFSGWVSVERYAHTVTAVAERHGLRDTLAAMRDAVLRTFPREATSVAIPSWVASAVATVECVGIPRFVATFVTRLRVELD